MSRQHVLTFTKQQLGKSKVRIISPVEILQIITFGADGEAAHPVLEQVATKSPQTLTQFTACRASIVRINRQSGNDQTRSNLSKQPDTMKSDDVSKSETVMRGNVMLVVFHLVHSVNLIIPFLSKNLDCLITPLHECMNFNKLFWH